MMLYFLFICEYAVLVFLLALFCFAHGLFVSSSLGSGYLLTFLNVPLQKVSHLLRGESLGKMLRSQLPFSLSV